MMTRNQLKRRVAIKLGLQKPAKLTRAAQTHYNVMMGTFNRISREVEPIIQENRDAHARMFSFDARHGIENNEENYGRSVHQTRQKYAGEIRLCRPNSGPSCDCEVSEIERGLMYAAGRNESIERDAAGL